MKRLNDGHYLDGNYDNVNDDNKDLDGGDSDDNGLIMIIIGMIRRVLWLLE